MSHVATVEIEVRDLGALEEACKRVGVELVRNQTSFKGGRRTKSEHLIRVPGIENAYEIGVCARDDGRAGFTLQADFWEGGSVPLTQRVGAGASKLKQAYATVCAARQCRMQGFMVQEIKGADGSIQLIARK